MRARSPNAIADRLSVAVFPSSLGWMAVAGSARGLRQLTFGHASPAAALAGLPRAGTKAGILPDVADNGVVTWNPQLVARLQAYAKGTRDDFGDVLLDDRELGPFQRRVVAGCRKIPYGETLTYGGLAALAGSPRAARAVGTTMSTNCTPLVVPCHRVVAASGLGNYSAGEGVRMKLRLLEMEHGAPLPAASSLKTKKRPTSRPGSPV